MPASARAIAAAFRQRQPGLGARTLQALLYYTQGHHLTFFGRPLFADTISISDSAPSIDALWDDAGDAFSELSGLGEAELNTVGYVLSRYGLLSAQELEDGIRDQTPWRRARESWAPGGGARIEVEWIREFFAVEAEKDDLGVDFAEMKRMLEAAVRRKDEPRRTDSLEDIRALLADRG